VELLEEDVVDEANEDDELDEEDEKEEEDARLLKDETEEELTTVGVDEEDALELEVVIEVLLLRVAMT
jgi:hypothetical protein